MLTIEHMYELAQRAARHAPTTPACDREDLIQSAVLGMLEARPTSVGLAAVIARRRVVDEILRVRGRTERGAAGGRVPAREVVHLYQPVSAEGICLADMLPAEEDLPSRIEEHIDAVRALPVLLRAVGRRAKHVLIWHVVQGRSMAEIAARYGVSESRVSQIMAEARRRARAVQEARAAPPAGWLEPLRPSRSLQTVAEASWFEATEAERRAFGEFRRLQRAGLNRREALAAMPAAQRELVASYQRKVQRRARARAAGRAVPKLPPRSQNRSRDALPVIRPEEAAAAALVAALRRHGLSWAEALRRVPPEQRALAEAYNVKSSRLARWRRRLAAS